MTKKTVATDPARRSTDTGTSDVELQALLIDRKRLQRSLAHVLRRAGPSDPKRKETNQAKAKRRKQLRRDLRLNAEQIATRCLELFDPDQSNGQSGTPTDNPE